MNIFSLLNEERTRAHLEAGGKKKVLEYLSAILASDLSVSAEQVFSHLIARERLGSTGLGMGVALPHSRVADIEAPIGALVTLARPIEFNSPDEQLVDIVFCLLVPDRESEEHLQLLAGLAKLFSADNMCDHIRSATDADEILNLIHHWQQHAAA